MARPVLGALIAVGIVGGALAGSKPTDPEVLARMGQVVANRVEATIPEASRVAGPLVAFKPGDALPIEEKVRMRVRTDKAMDGADVRVVAGPEPGEVRLRGVVLSRTQWRRAADLASETLGVAKVVNELAVPE